MQCCDSMPLILCRGSRSTASWPLTFNNVCNSAAFGLNSSSYHSPTPGICTSQLLPLAKVASAWVTVRGVGNTKCHVALKGLWLTAPSFIEPSLLPGFFVGYANNQLGIVDRRPCRVAKRTQCTWEQKAGPGIVASCGKRKKSAH